MGDHLLAHGLAGSPLRALAAAAGTSDRMLLYYFADRDELLGVLLDHVATRLHALLATVPLTPQPWTALLQLLWDQARGAAMRPYLQLFLDLATAAGRGEEPHRTAASRIAASFIDWTAARLDPAQGAPQARAALLLATLDGLFLLDGSGRGTDAEAALAILLSGGQAEAV
ncbi:TetR/AcrR family transcriptional regulator [Sphingomonas sp.]|uniref:TetR/AcrR family transcriptional regulator n=1 Tax=Sphingomonas sp. TaxID=28214 RepID=UPI003CC5C975